MEAFRNSKTASVTVRETACVSAFLVFGLVLGFAAKRVDGSPFFPLNVLSDIGSRIGIWVFIATITASRSRSPGVGAVRVLVFFAGMLLSYYAYSMKLFGFFPTYYFLRWGVLALTSPLAAHVVWFSRGEGWIPALCAALPIGFLAAQGYSFPYTLAAAPGFDLAAAVVLFFALPRRGCQYLRVFLLGLGVLFLARKSDVMARLMGVLH